MALETPSSISFQSPVSSLLPTWWTCHYDWALRTKYREVIFDKSVKKYQFEMTSSVSYPCFILLDSGHVRAPGPQHYHCSDLSAY